MSEPMVVGIFTLAGGLSGGGIVLVANLLQSRYQDFRLRKAIAGALAGEIEGLILAVERRRYLDWLDIFIQRQREILRSAEELNAKQPSRGEPSEIRLPTFGPRVTFNYFAVFDKTCEKIGLLGEIAGKVALLYTLAKGIVEDMNLLREGAQFQSVSEVIQLHEELRDILAENLRRGRELIQALREMDNEKFLWFFS